MLMLRFREGKDNDLKEWYRELPKGERSRVVRKILREHIKSKKINEEVKFKEVELKVINTREIDEKIDSLMGQF